MVAVKKDSTKNMAKKKTTTAKSKSAKGKQASAAKADDLVAGNAHLKTTLQQIEKQFGEGSIMPLGKEQRRQIEGIATGSLSLDMALGGQGVPQGARLGS